MRTNCIFTTYRRATSGSERIYSGSATITNGTGFIQPAGGDMKAILGLDLAVKAYSLTTDLRNFQKYDKITISSPTSLAGDYYIEQLELSDFNDFQRYRLIIKQDE